MKKAEYRDRTYQIKYDNNEIYTQIKPAYLKTIAQNTKQSKSKYLFKLNMLASKKPIAILLPYLFLHTETLNSPSRQCISMLGEAYNRLIKEAKFLEKSQALYLIFGDENSQNKDLRNRIKQSSDLNINQFGFRESDSYLKELLQKNRLHMSNKQLSYYTRGCEKNIMALFPEQIQTRKLFLKRLFKQLAPMYGLALTSNNYMYIEKQQIFIVADQYDRKRYIREFPNKAKGSQNKQIQKNKQQDQLDFVVSLEDIVFWLKLGEFKQINMSQFVEDLVKDLTKQLILYYSLTKKSYPSLNPLNIHFNTSEKVFLLSVEPVLIDGLGFNLGNFSTMIDFLELTNKMQYYHQEFTNHRIVQNEFQGVLLNAAFLWNKVTDLILIDYAETPWKVGNMANYLTILKDKQNKWDDIDSIFEANEKFKYGAIGIDMHYKQHQIYWLKYKICEQICGYEKQKSLDPKIKSLKYFYCLLTAVCSPKNKQRARMLRLFSSIRETVKDEMDHYREQIEEQLGSQIEVENTLWKYYKYLQYIGFANQSKTEKSRMHYLNFPKLERDLIQSTRSQFEQLKDQKPTQKIYTMYNLLERLHEDNFDELTFRVYNQLLKPKEYNQLKILSDYVNSLRKRI